MKIRQSVESLRGSARRSMGTSPGTAVLVAIVASLAILAPLLMVAGVGLGEGYRVLFGASLDSPYAFSSLLLSTTPLLIAAVGVTLAYRGGMVNVGGDGQIIIGAISATLLFRVLGDLPGVIAVLLVAVFGACTAGAWSWIAGALKKWRSVNEIISTIMLNIVALLLVQFLVSGPLKGGGLQYAATDQAPLPMWLRDLTIGPLMIPVGFLAALLLLALVAVTTHYSAWGWRQRVVGLGEHLALRQRLKVSTVQLHSMVLSGAIAGLAGVLELLGNQHRVGYAFSPGWGFDALAIALLAQGRFPAVLPLALYFGALLNGSQSLQSELALSGNFIHLLVGLPVLVAAALIGYVRHAPRGGGFSRLRTKEA